MELYDLNSRLCKALGVDPKQVSHLTLTLTCDDYPTLTITKLVFDGDPVPLVSEIVSQTRLVPVDEDEPEEPSVVDDVVSAEPPPPDQRWL